MPDAAGAVYLDSSALIKLIVVEDESATLRRELTERPRASSLLAVVEVSRAALRHGGVVAREAEKLFRAIALRPIDRDVVDRAARVEPPELRSLDAIHLATALLLTPPPEMFCSYDVRLSAAARAAGLRVEAPA